MGVERVTDDYMELISDPEIEAVHVCTPNVLHAPVTKAAIKAGKHVLCEKPLAMTAAEAKEMLKLAHKKRASSTASITTFATTRWCSTSGK